MSGAPSDLLAFGRALAALAGVLLLLTACLWLVRRHGTAWLRPRQECGALAIEAALMLDARTRLVVVRHRTVEHLLVVGPAGANLLDTRPAPVPGGSGAAA